MATAVSFLGMVLLVGCSGGGTAPVTGGAGTTATGAAGNGAAGTSGTGAAGTAATGVGGMTATGGAGMTGAAGTGTAGASAAGNVGNTGSAGVAGGGAGTTAPDGGTDAGATPTQVLPVLRTGLYVLEFGKTKLVVDPAKGARIVELSLDGTNILTGPTENPMYWGSTLWSAPEGDWLSGGLIPAFDTGTFTMSVGADSSFIAVGPTSAIASNMK